MTYTIHGAAKRNIRLYRMWGRMIQRCYTPTVESYPLYGGRGITVCAEWHADPMVFVDWAEKQKGSATLSLDRIDPNGPYSPDNCRFLSVKEQARNRRSNLLLTHNGEVRCLAGWCELLGLKVQTVWSRLKRGHTVAEALQPAGPVAPRRDLSVDGRTMSAGAWAAEIGVSVSTIYTRHRKGKSITDSKGPSGPKPTSVYVRKPGPVPRSMGGARWST